jgi:DNA-binding MarR family transcriptional regulator
MSGRAPTATRPTSRSSRPSSSSRADGLVTRLRSVAREHGIDPQLIRLLLLFADSNRPLRIGNVAELLGVTHTTAGRVATNAQTAGLVDKFTTIIDGREVVIIITVEGRAAVTSCLQALRAPAARILGVSGETTTHPRGEELIAMLGKPPALARTRAHAGWRAGVRAGMWPPF